MLSRFGFGQEAIAASGSDAEIAAFLEKEAEEANAKKKKDNKQKKQTDEDRPKLFMELTLSEQRKLGQKAPVLRQVEGDSVNQRIRLYRRTIFFHIHSKLDHNGYIAQRLRLNNQNPNGKDEKGRTALHYACRHGAEGVVRTLLHEETTIDDPDLEMRWTPLHYAVMGGHEKIVQRLVEKAPVRRITINRKDKNGMTPLMLACGEDHAGVAKLLLRKKAFIDETDNDGWSALHYAAANDAALAAEVLVQYDINLKARTESTNETALEMAERLRSHLVAILLYEVTYRKH
ncbi:hypothetical protein F442_11946 [Phytophthora nicotianae P10297]|uniref:Uncharacterized protein n=3 Tax=Phytophthora nicotianae TaxID=4792 RepID=V9EVP6_PHYNI|nr:hypothetical protein F443_12036 [Phytophthora nicotianae P1569]ETL89554.1 hypothetical protein L917_11538 [Phytophthora nicotianae]ETM42837.1 hypothetical protein L914_11584 [Phytophthora nicotianae]ETP40776.1 hypothetical protein F442_11946 [Phytophthora nicotianae P10297]